MKITEVNNHLENNLFIYVQKAYCTVLKTRMILKTKISQMNISCPFNSCLFSPELKNKNKHELVLK